MKNTILYFHGFNSSPRSAKAELFRLFLQERHPEIDYQVPSIPDEPHQAIPHLDALIQKVGEKHIIGLIGSSLGGYYANYFSQKYQLSAAVINPAVRPFELLLQFLGENHNPYTQKRYALYESHIQDLKNIYIEPLPHPELLLLLQEKGDEILDYREAQSYYHNAQSIILEGGNHAFSRFDEYLATIYQFLSTKKA